MSINHPARPAGAESLAMGRIEAFSDGVIAVAITLLVLNLLLLLCIVVLSFSTSLLATYLDAPSGGHLAAVVYAGSFLVTSSVFVALQCHLLLRRAHLLREQCTGSDVRTILLRAAIAPPAYLLAGAAGIASPYLTLAVCVALGIFYLLAPPSGSPSAER